MRHVLTLLCLHKLFVILSKYAFGQSHMKYLGHIVVSDGVRVDTQKIEAIIQ